MVVVNHSVIRPHNCGTGSEVCGRGCSRGSGRAVGTVVYEGGAAAWGGGVEPVGCRGRWPRLPCVREKNSAGLNRARFGGRDAKVASEKLEATEMSWGPNANLVLDH